jgi:hypothetical protein
VQGKNQWYYQYFNGSSYANMIWTNDFGGAWQGNETHSLVGAGWFHPGPNVDSVLKWVAPTSGTWQIIGTAYDGDPGGGDGVFVKIMQGSTVIWSVIIPNGGTAQNHNLTRTISAGEVLYFSVNRLTNNSYDVTGWNPTIIYIGP